MICQKVNGSGYYLDVSVFESKRSCGRRFADDFDSVVLFGALCGEYVEGIVES